MCTEYQWNEFIKTVSVMRAYVYTNTTVGLICKLRPCHRKRKIRTIPVMNACPGSYTGNQNVCWRTLVTSAWNTCPMYVRPSVCPCRYCEIRKLVLAPKWLSYSTEHFMANWQFRHFHGKAQTPVKPIVR